MMCREKDLSKGKDQVGIYSRERIERGKYCDLRQTWFVCRLEQLRKWFRLTCRWDPPLYTDLELGLTNTWVNFSEADSIQYG